MIDHVSVTVSDLVVATDFYRRVLGVLGFQLLEARHATVGFGKNYPEFWINLRAEMVPLAATHGAHIALRARGTAVVDAFYAEALAAGAIGDGAPGLRPHDGEGGYYAAFIRDPDGNRLEAVTFIVQA